MCAGACLNARLDRVVYGAADQAAGCLGSRVNLFAMGLGPPPGILPGVLAEECGALLQDFFDDINHMVEVHHREDEHRQRRRADAGRGGRAEDTAQGTLATPIKSPTPGPRH